MVWQVRLVALSYRGGKVFPRLCIKHLAPSPEARIFFPSPTHPHFTVLAIWPCLSPTALGLGGPERNPTPGRRLRWFAGP
jgi:hypothetical protein